MAAPIRRPRVKKGSPRLGIRRTSRTGAQRRTPPPPAPGRRTARAPREAETLTEARRRTEILRRQVLDLDLRIRNGELVEKAAVDGDWFSAARIIRNRILAVPSRCAAELHACDSVAAVQRTLARALQEALHGVADEIA